MTEADHSRVNLGAMPCLWMVLGLCVWHLASPPAVVAATFAPDQIEFFEKKIRPLLSNRCFRCHSNGAEKIKGGFLLDSRDAALKGGDTGDDVVPGRPEKSLLIEAVRYENKDTLMPPKTKLSAAEIADLTEWVRQGAPWPEEAKPAARTASAKKAFNLEARKREHWCWEPLGHPAPPSVRDTSWSALPIDHFVLAKLEEKQLRPAPPADTGTLLRRLYFDLTGLPPAPEEVEAFRDAYAADPSSAVERTVDQLLASPSYGERWARHWLDLVRYAESKGHEIDAGIPNAWQYRDYVIRALNSDVPYDQFVIEHLAGDLLPSPRLDPRTGGNESILGTGFWFLGEEMHSPVDIRQDEADRMDNRLDVMCKTFLGMTVTCARCHDHKFDAISQRDYYALTGFLISSTYRQAPFETMEQNREIAMQLDKLRNGERSRLLQGLASAQKSGIQRTADYLIAARELLLGEGVRLACGGDAGAAPQVAPLEEIANRDGLEQTKLNRWAGELKTARTLTTHPLHAFAEVALEQHGDDPTEFTSRLSPILAAWQKQKLAAPPDPGSLVIDYANPGSGDWLQDGWIFGRRPARVGDPLFGFSADRPITGIVTRGSAQRDPAWNSLSTEGAERDHGKFGEWGRGGNVLRTPDVTLSAGSLWYLVRGPGRAYAAVNSHTLISGPLHNALLKEWPDKAGQWHWVEHKLEGYRGHRAHVQFSPVGTEPFAIAKVVQSDARPVMADSPNELLLETLGDPEINSPKAMAEAVQRLFAKVGDLMAADGLSASSHSAELEDWLVRHEDLFVSSGNAESESWGAAAQEFIKLQSEIAGRIRPTPHTAPAMLDGNGVDEFVLIRGQTKLPGEPAPRRFLEAIAGPQPMKIASGSGRLELARQMVDSSNPFASRVIVNRVWHHLFGRGIVPTVDNFGVLGQPPSHRALLDYLAVHFVTDQGWSVKKLIREIVLSKAYQMSSAPSDALAEQADPENLLLHRMNLKRLEGEAIRDAVLAVSGRLDPKAGGPSVPVFLTPFMDGRGKPGGGPLDGKGRRSIYISVRRNFLSPMMLAFDTPIPFTSMGRRNVSNVPAQALILMNDPFIVEQTQVWARKLLEIKDPAARLRRMYLAAFGRPPDGGELRQSLAFIASQSDSSGAPSDDLRVWADLGHVLLNVKGFIYLN